MELYDKKFLIYGNCMIRSFGHPGSFALNCSSLSTKLIGMFLSVCQTHITIFPNQFVNFISFYQSISKLSPPLFILSNYFHSKI